MQLAYKRTKKKIDARKEAYTQDRIRRGFERGITQRLINYFSKIGNGAAKALEESGTTGFDVYLSQSRPELEKVLKPHWYEVIKTFASRVDNYLFVKRADNAFFTELLEKFTFRVGANHISDIDSTTRKQLQRVLVAGQKDGLPLPQISKNIRERFSPKFTRSRSATIARTETHSAASFANHQQGIEYQKIQPNLNKQWVAVNDDRTREAHRIANGQVVSMDENFIVGGRPMEYTGDPKGGAANVINCRCAIIYIDDETEVFDEQQNVVQPVDLTDTTEPSTAKPLSIEALLAPAINRSLRGDTLKISSTREIKKQLDERTKKVKPEYNQIDFDIENSSGFDYSYGSRFGGTPFKNNLKNLDDVTATAVFEVLKELDDLAVRFDIPKLNSIQPVKRVKGKEIVASMGDGILGIEANIFNQYAKGIKGAKPISERDALKLSKLDKELDELKVNVTALTEEGKKFNEVRKVLDLSPLKINPPKSVYDSWIARYKIVLEKQTRAERSKARINESYDKVEFTKNTWKRGDELTYRAGNGLTYFDDGLDRIRNNMYHEFGHHVHQITKVSNAENYGLREFGGVTDIERRLQRINKKNIEEGGPSIYSSDNDHEWFAENFALYFQDRKDLTDPVFNEFIQDIMKEANGI